MEQDTSQFTNELKDKARKIVNFKIHFVIYLLACLMTWIIAFFLNYAFNFSLVWAIFPCLIWTTIILFHYLWIFKWNKTQVEKEYIKLLKKEEKRNNTEENKIKNSENN